jgi:hypothetical protein
MLRKIFDEFMKILSKGLNPFKIQANLIFDSFPGFLIQNPEGIGSRAKMEVCLVRIYLSTHQIWKVLELSKIAICIFWDWSYEIFGKEFFRGNWVGPIDQYRPPSFSGPWPTGQMAIAQGRHAWSPIPACPRQTAVVPTVSDRPSPTFSSGGTAAPTDLRHP